MAVPEQVQHVIVVMLENRSFDHLFGYLDDPGLDGIHPGHDVNLVDPANPASQAVPASEHAQLHLRVDPDHEHGSVMEQLGLTGGGEPTNNGFVWNYERQATGTSPGALKGAATRHRVGLAIGAVAVVLALAGVALLALGLWWGAAGLVLALVAGGFGARFASDSPYFPGDGPRIMGCWDPATLPALSALASSFTLCQRWFSSVPGETWPNRQFAHAATSAGTVDITIRLYHDTTIFEQLEAGGRQWRIYYDGPAQVACYEALWKDKDRLAYWFEIQHLFDHIAAGDLPAYSFVEPNHGYIGRSYSQHPGNNGKTNADFLRADRFVAGVYEALRANPALIEKTLLLVTWDEHGGTYDHVPPPATVAPDGRTDPTYHFGFTRLGVRVPAIVVSPWCPEGLSDVEYDHASIPATLRQHFVPGASPLTARDRDAASFLPLLSRPQPRRGGELPDLSAHAWQPKAAWNPFDPLTGLLRRLARGEEPLNVSLGRLAAHLDRNLNRPRAETPFREQAPAEGDLPPLHPLHRQRSARAMRKLRAHAERSRRR